MSMRTMNIGMIGYKFMGRAHSNGWLQSQRFFDTEIAPVLKAVCGRHEEPLKEFADRWGWEETISDWRALIARDDIDIIDVAAPQYLHYDIALAAAKAGKHIFMEKPLALSVEQAQEMVDVIGDRPIVHYLNHNYRRCPAVRLAKRLIDEGRIGRIYHWRGAYLQEWAADPEYPLTWQMKKTKAGSGPHGDLNSHSIDLARYLVGEIAQVSAMMTRFIAERPLPDAHASSFSRNAGITTGTGKVTVEDASFMTVMFENGALGSFDATRFATGRKNAHNFEIYGSRGALIFDLERMNELQYYCNDDHEGEKGFRTIMATEPVHEYASSWWPPGHIIGYEHTFVHAAADFLQAIAEKTEIRPNFFDGLQEMIILEAGIKSAAEGRTIIID